MSEDDKLDNTFSRKVSGGQKKFWDWFRSLSAEEGKIISDLMHANSRKKLIEEHEKSKNRAEQLFKKWD